MTARTVRHEFVEFVPDELEEGVVYVSIPYATVVHKCMCGCGSEVVLPLSPVDWRLTYDGESISLYPSIGNWDLACRSHYWIQSNAVCWAKSWSKRDVEAAKGYDRQQRSRHFGNGQHPASTAEVLPGVMREAGSSKRRWIQEKLLRGKKGSAG